MVGDFAGESGNILGLGTSGGGVVDLGDNHILKHVSPEVFRPSHFGMGRFRAFLDGFEVSFHGVTSGATFFCSMARITIFRIA